MQLNQWSTASSVKSSPPIYEFTSHPNIEIALMVKVHVVEVS